MANDKMFFINVDKTSKDRFDIGKFMEFSDNYDPLTSNFLKDLNSEVSARQVFQILSEEGRPDLISSNIYRDTQYWWVFALYNKKISWDNFVIGETLQMPEMDSLEDFYFGMKAKEHAQR
jgi:hypothetical protein